MKNHSNRESNSRTLKLFSRNFLRKSQVLVLLFLLVVSACQNQQEKNESEARKIILKNDNDKAMAAYLEQNGIITLSVSQNQRKTANENLNFVTKFLANFMHDEHFTSIFIQESKKSLTNGGIPGILVEDFLKAYEEKTGKSLLQANNQYRVENNQTSKFLSLVGGFSLETDRMSITIKPRLYMPVLDDRFFSRYEQPKGIFTGHFYENSDKISLYSQDENNVITSKLKERKELSLSSNISVVGAFKQESQYFLVKDESKIIVIRMMNTPCSCFATLPGPVCQNGHCLPAGFQSSGCGYAVEVPSCEGCEPQIECEPYCCQIIQ